jgi:DNA-binding LytR/AlgR family response regulator
MFKVVVEYKNNLGKMQLKMTSQQVVDLKQKWRNGPEQLHIDHTEGTILTHLTDVLYFSISNKDISE